MSQELVFTNGFVTSPNYLATLAGVDVLRHGGNALDCAIAVALTLAVVYPHMCTLGGDAFWLIYVQDQDKLLGLNASGRSAELAQLSTYQKLNCQEIPKRGYLACNTVPGVVSGLKAVYALSQNELKTQVSWESLFASARLYAEEGFPVSSSLAKWSKHYKDCHKLDPHTNPLTAEFARVFFPQNAPLASGQIFKQPDLANTLALLAKEGGDAFYLGAIAEKIASSMQEHGGLVRANDLAKHRALWVEPITVNYRGYTAANLPPNTQGLASLEILNILQNFDLKSIALGSASYYHLLIEATKEAFLDRDTYVTDPSFVDIPVDQLLSAKHGQAQALRIDFNRAKENLSPLAARGDTVYMGCVDRFGNAVSMIQSIYYDFGSAIVPQNTGLILQNRGCYFSLDANHPNVLAPKKRTLHTLNPAMLLKDSKPYLVYGTMGGEGQPQTQAQLITRIIDYQMDVHTAIDCPRFLYGRAWGDQTNKVFLEGRIEDSVCRKLASLGHKIAMVEDYADLMGMAGLILCQNGAFVGASDPRSDGLALGF